MATQTFVVRIYGPDDAPTYGRFSINDAERVTLLRRHQAFLEHKAAEPSLDEHQYNWGGLEACNGPTDDAAWELFEDNGWAVAGDDIKPVEDGGTFEYERLAVDAFGFHIHAYCWDDELVTASVPWTALEGT